MYNILFPIILIIGMGFGWYARRFGFTSMWIALFNAAISIYLGVMLIPTVVAYVPAFASPYAKVMCGFGLAITVFVIAQYTVVMTFEHALDVTLPEMFSKIGSVLSGFLIALVILSFFTFNLFSMLSISNPDSNWVNSITAQKTYSITYSVCDFVHKLGAHPDSDTPAEALTEWYAAKPGEKKNNKDTKEGETKSENQVEQL